MIHSEPEDWKKVRVLVTGGAGFLGSHLCERLLDAGYKVIALDNFYTGTRENVSHLLLDDRFELIRHDVIEPTTIEVDFIVNLACPASPVHYQKDPVRTVKTSVLGTLNMLELAKRKNIPILQASTSEVYGDPNVSPQSENYLGNVNPIGIRACYDEGKRVAETLLFDHHRQYGVDVKLARIFNTYGPRMQLDDGRVVSNFIAQALKNDDISIYGDGSQTRSFCYVSDLIEGLIKLLQSPSNVTGPINLGNPHEITILELAQVIINLTSSKSKIVMHELPQDDPRKRQPDIDLAKTQLKWEPQVDLVSGLNLTIRDFRARIFRNE